ncbi:MAG TPA: OsmC family protein [Kiritimatiellia bacterium]|nr:OsmC family protein [Kiritimatiellia bacterium]
MYTYETSLNWTGAMSGAELAAGRPELPISAPAEFGGDETRWNPELLLVAAIESCLLLTTLSIAKRQNIALSGYASSAVGHMAKTPEGLRFQEIIVTVSLTVAAGTDEAKAAQLVHTAEKYCPVSNAVKCPVKVEVKVQAA